MRLLSEFFPEFSEMLDDMDALYTDKRTIDEKTYQFICFATQRLSKQEPVYRRIVDDENLWLGVGTLQIVF